MRINLIAVGNKMPTWITTGYQEYVKRLRPDIQLQLHEINPCKRGKNYNANKFIDEESTKILTAIKPDTHTIALDSRGKSWTSEQLAKELATWKTLGKSINLLVGGPDGMNKTCLEKADQCWSLSGLTLPHPLVRIVIAEQLYRANSILKNHPYHR